MTKEYESTQSANSDQRGFSICNGVASADRDPNTPCNMEECLRKTQEYAEGGEREAKSANRD